MVTSARWPPPAHEGVCAIASASSSKPVSCPPSRLCGVLPTKSVPTICNRNGWLPLLREQVARIASSRQTNFHVSSYLNKRGTMHRRDTAQGALSGIVVERQSAVVE